MYRMFGLLGSLILVCFLGAEAQVCFFKGFLATLKNLLEFLEVFESFKQLLEAFNNC